MTRSYTVHHNEPLDIHYRLWDGFSGDLAFDIGAHLGQSVEAIIISGRFRRVVSCEPAAETFGRLSGFYGDDERVKLLCTAVGAEAGTMVLAECRVAISGGELVSPALAGHSANTYWADPVGCRTVPCTTLDDLAAEYGMPDLVKVDTEGSEVQVLLGGGSLIGTAGWLVEWHTPELLGHCRLLLGGYDLEVIEDPRSGGQIGWLKAVL